MTMGKRNVEKPKKKAGAKTIEKHERKAKEEKIYWRKIGNEEFRMIDEIVQD
jgi:hypothetical protein